MIIAMVFLTIHEFSYIVGFVKVNSYLSISPLWCITKIEDFLFGGEKVSSSSSYLSGKIGLVPKAYFYSCVDIKVGSGLLSA